MIRLSYDLDRMDRSSAVVTIQWRPLYLSAATLCTVLASQPGQAKGVFLDFEGIGNSVAIQNFYNGGAASNGAIGRAMM
jgi:hypothetical protein